MTDPTPVRDKADMYRRLAAGEFGNTTRQYFSVREWAADPATWKHERWGVRTLRPGGPCRLHCHAEDVPQTALRFREPVNISMMVDSVAAVTLMADVWDSPTGLIVYGIEYPEPRANWRQVMPTRGMHYEGTAARMLLGRHLNANSDADLRDLFERLPGHVCELSALDRCVGVVPHRNSIVWEVRAY